MVIKIINIFLKKKISLFIFNKASFIPTIFLNRYIYVFNGINFRKLYVFKYIVNFRIGNFIFSKKIFKFNKKQKKIKR